MYVENFILLHIIITPIITSSTFLSLSMCPGFNLSSKVKNPIFFVKYVHTRMILPELTLVMSYFLIHVYQNAIYLCEMGIHVP